MTTATAPNPTINNYQNDYTSPTGVRICTPIYLDLNTSQRKELLNAVRTVSSQTVTTPTRSQSGIAVETNNGSLNAVEAYLGTSIDLLRTILFQRGGLSVDLILKLQHVTGVEIVSVKEIEAALKARAALVKSYTTTFPFTQ